MLGSKSNSLKLILAAPKSRLTEFACRIVCIGYLYIVTPWDHMGEVLRSSTSTLDRTTFDVPPDIGDPSLIGNIYADNAAMIALNGREIGRHPCWEAAMTIWPSVSK